MFYDIVFIIRLREIKSEEPVAQVDYESGLTKIILDVHVRFFSEYKGTGITKQTRMSE